MRLLILIISFLLVICSGTTTATGIEDGPLHTLLWNEIDAVTVVDSFAVGIAHNAVVVCRFDDSLGMFKTASHIRVNYNPIKIAQHDSLLVIVTDDNRLVFYNTQNLPELTYLWTVDPGIPFADYALTGKFVYFSSWFNGIWRFRIDENGATRFIDSSMVGVLMTDLEVDDNTLYALDAYNGIMRYDLSEDGFGRFVDYLYIPEEIKSFVKTGNQFLIVSKTQKVLFGTFDLVGPRITDSLVGLGYIYNIYVTLEQYIFVEPRRIRLVDRYDHSLQTDIAGGNELDGDTFSLKGHQYLLLPKGAGGMTMYDLEVAGVVKPGLYRSGPIEALRFIDGHLFTSGGENPIDVFTFDSAATPNFAYTMFEEIQHTQAMVNNYDTLIAYFARLNKVAFIPNSTDPDSFFIERTLTLNDTLAGEMQFLTEKIDTLRALITVGETSIRAYTISDSSFITPVEPWKFHGRIRSALVKDSLLFVATNKNQLWINRITKDFDTEILSIFELEGTARKLVAIDNRLFVFVEQKMLIYDFEDPANIRFVEVVKLPLSVVDAVVTDDKMYAVGPEGVAVFAIEERTPYLTSFGGVGGTMLAVEGNILAVSDGGSLDIYRLTDEEPLIFTEPEQSAPFIVFQNYPNPFNSGTSIRFALTQSLRVKITVYNLLGQEVRTLLDTDRPAGDYEIYWDGTDFTGRTVASGIYFYRFTAGDIVKTRKMVLLK